MRAALFVGVLSGCVAGCIKIDAADPSNDKDTLASLSCNEGDVPRRTADGWLCAPALGQIDRLTCPDGAIPRRAGGVWTCGDDTFSTLSCRDGESLVRRNGAWACTAATVQVDLRNDRTSSTGVAARDLQQVIDDLRDRVRRLEGPPGYARIPPGAFLMGSPAGEPGRYADEGPQVMVHITRPFWLKITEVTQREWCDVVGCPTGLLDPANPSDNRPCAACPVEQVSWNDAVRYLNALSEKEGLDPCYTGMSQQWRFRGLDCQGYRLPTDAEWEYAARAGSAEAFYTGPITAPAEDCAALDTSLDRAGWYQCNSGGKSKPVKQKMSNAFGLFDVLGNVAEWTNDLYAADALTTCAATPGGCSDPSTPATGGITAADGVMTRGGSFASFARHSRAAFRRGITVAGGVPPQSEIASVGLRPARTVGR